MNYDDAVQRRGGIGVIRNKNLTRELQGLGVTGSAETPGIIRSFVCNSISSPV